MNILCWRKTIMSRIVAKRTGENGAIDLYKLDDGTTLNRMQAVEAADKGQLEGVSSFTTRDGDKAIRSDRGQPDYSLSDLPEF